MKAVLYMRVGNRDQLGYPEQEMVEKIRRDYPRGCRVVLDFMEDAYGQAPPSGTQGTVTSVDDIGTIHCAWDNGCGLGVAYGADRCHRVASEAEIKVSLDLIGRTRHRGGHCPRCGEAEAPGRRLLALSRRADITVCEMCGTEEALEDASLLERRPLSEWAVVKGW